MLLYEFTNLCSRGVYQHHSLCYSRYIKLKYFFTFWNIFSRALDYYTTSVGVKTDENLFLEASVYLVFCDGFRASWSIWFAALFLFIFLRRDLCFSNGLFLGLRKGRVSHARSPLTIGARDCGKLLRQAIKRHTGLGAVPVGVAGESTHVVCQRTLLRSPDHQIVVAVCSCANFNTLHTLTAGYLSLDFK